MYIVEETSEKKKKQIQNTSPNHIDKITARLKKRVKGYKEKGQHIQDATNEILFACREINNVRVVKHWSRLLWEVVETL